MQFRADPGRMANDAATNAAPEFGAPKGNGPGLASDDRDAAVAARYHFRYRRQDAAFRAFDCLLQTITWFGRGRISKEMLPRPKRILLANAGHLGDVILTTALLPVLHHAFPGVEVGFLGGTYCRVLVDGHPLISRTHFIDHWYQSRVGSARISRMVSYLRALPALVRELRIEKYDIAIDVRAWFPNFIPALWAAGIPVRVGYNRIGFGPLLTHALGYVYGRRHELEYQLDLLRSLGISQDSLAEAWPTLIPPSPEALRGAKSFLGDVTRYRILHPMASTPTRDWDPAKWILLARELIEAGITPVITGSGKKQRDFAEGICASAPGSVNAVDGVSWSELMALIQGAEMVYAVETSIGHVASALRRPVVSLYGGMADPSHWAPIGAKVATKLTPCHPCINKRGCVARECITGVTLKDVMMASEAALPGFQ